MHLTKLSRRVAGLVVSHVESVAEDGLSIHFTDGSSLTLSAHARLSHLLILAADVDPPRNRMYFRSGKFELLRDKHGVPISDSLIRLAEGEELTFLLDYRDGLAHTVRLNSAALGAASVDEYFDESGQVQRMRSANWSSEELLGIALMSSALVRTALHEVGQHCQALLNPGV